MAYFFPGTPPPSATCTSATGGCWLYAGWNQSMSMTQYGWFKYPTPYLPPGTYTFQLTNVTGDADLYVRANAPVGNASGQYDCASIYGGTTNESCTITLGERGGIINVMVYGYAPGTSTATLTSRN